MSSASHQIWPLKDHEDLIWNTIIGFAALACCHHLAQASPIIILDLLDQLLTTAIDDPICVLSFPSFSCPLLLPMTDFCSFSSELKYEAEAGE